MSFRNDLPLLLNKAKMFRMGSTRAGFMCLRGSCQYEKSFTKKQKPLFGKNEFALTFEFGPSVADGCGAYIYSVANERREIKMFLQFLGALTLFIFI